MSIIEAVEALPQSSVTVTALQALDHVVPGEWDNTTSFDALSFEALRFIACLQFVAKQHLTGIRAGGLTT